MANEESSDGLKPAAWIFKTLLLLAVLQSCLVSSCEPWPCPDLKFCSNTSGCLPCRLYNNASSNRRPIREECRNKNPNPIWDGRYVWSDVENNDEFPLPACRPVNPEFIVESSNCNTRNSPGDWCIIICGNVERNITCTENVTWDFDPSSCPTTTVATTAEITTTERVVPHQPSRGQEASGDHTLAIIVGVIGFILVAVIVFSVVYIRYLHKRLERRNNFERGGSSKSTSKSSMSNDVFVEGSVVEHSKSLLNGACPGNERATGMILDGKGTGMNSEVEGEPLLGRSENGNGNVSVQAEKPVEVVCVPAAPAAREREQSQQRSAAVHAAAATPMQVQHKAVHMPEHMEKAEVTTDSFLALGDLLNDRTAAFELCHMFDHHSRFDTVTWHDIASFMLGLDAYAVNSFEYRTIPTSGEQLGESPTYRVLLQVHQGHGLLEFRDFLQNQLEKFKRDAHNAQKAIQFLNEYWKDWKERKRPTSSPWRKLPQTGV